MHWTFVAPQGCVFNLWHVPGGSAVRLQFDTARGPELLEWLKRTAAECEAELNKPPPANPRIRPIVIQPIRRPEPKTANPSSPPPISDSVHATTAVPMEIAIQAQYPPPIPPDPPEIAVLKGAKQSAPPTPAEPVKIRPPLESIELGNICPCQTKLDTPAVLQAHWEEGHMDYAPPPEGWEEGHEVPPLL